MTHPFVGKQCPGNHEQGCSNAKKPSQKLVKDLITHEREYQMVSLFAQAVQGQKHIVLVCVDLVKLFLTLLFGI